MQAVAEIDFSGSVRFSARNMFLRIIGVMGMALWVSCATGANKAKPAVAKPRKVDFVREIQPILEYNCVGCHREGEAKEHGGGYQLDIKE